MDLHVNTFCSCYNGAGQEDPQEFDAKTFG
jgi:hypothetical protein